MFISIRAVYKTCTIDKKQAVGLGYFIFLEGAMKKIVLLFLFVAIVSGSLFAQSNTPTITISGTLGLSNGMISVESGNTTYIVRGLERYIGFIDGLNYGARVSLEGYDNTPSVDGQNNRSFLPVTLTISGKIYEIGSPAIDRLAHGRNERDMGLRDGSREMRR